MRFTAKQHLRDKADFNRGKTYLIRRDCGGFVLIAYTPRIKREIPLRRLGVIASRKVGNAVTRNRSKRMLREIFRLNQDHLPECCDLILIAKKRCKEYAFDQLQSQFIKICENKRRR